MRRRPCQLKPRSAFQVLRNDNRRLERRWKLHIPCLSENQSSWRYGNLHAVYARILDERLGAESETKHWTNERCALGSARLVSRVIRVNWNGARPGLAESIAPCVTINPRARSHTRDHAANRARRGWVAGLLELLSISTVRPKQLALMLFVSCFFALRLFYFSPLFPIGAPETQVTCLHWTVFLQCNTVSFGGPPPLCLFCCCCCCCFLLLFFRKRGLPRKFASCVLS